MSSSRAAITPLPGHLTLQDVLTLVSADMSLPPDRRQDICSALRKMALAVGRPPEAIPAHPGYLRQRLERFTPAMAGMSERRWVNVVSLVRVALKHFGLSTVPGRYTTPMSPAWQNLWRHINDRKIRDALSRFARHCSDVGIAPEQVDDAVMGRFCSAITDEGIVRKPREVHRMACKAWNRLGGTVARRLQRLTEPSYKVVYTLPWRTFPQTLRSEVDIYLERLAGKDLLGEHDFRPLRLSSIATRERQLRQFASALVHRGRDPQTLRGLADLVAIDTLKDGLRFFLDRAGNKKTKYIRDLACALKAMARHQVKIDAEHLDRLRSICRQLDPGGRGLTDKNRDLLRQFDDEHNLAALLLLPERLVAEARQHKPPRRTDAVLVQLALAIEIELMVPLRIGNLAGLDLYRHLLRTRTNGRGVLHLVIPAEEVKNRIDIEAVLPVPTVALLELYLETYRPLLLTAPSSFLFPGKAGKPKDRRTLGLQISEVIRERTGLRVNPHAFRHIMTKIGLTAEPGNYGMMRLVNGHKSVGTVERYYSGTEGPVAVKRFDDHVLRLRDRLTQASLPHRKRRAI
jgi:integrase